MNYNNMNVGEVLEIYADVDEVVNIDVNVDEGR
jgi:TusA-related sulfurtransferase